jgi:hypothetical protein
MFEILKVFSCKQNLNATLRGCSMKLGLLDQGKMLLVTLAGVVVVKFERTALGSLQKVRMI